MVIIIRDWKSLLSEGEDRICSNFGWTYRIGKIHYWTGLMGNRLWGSLGWIFRIGQRTGWICLLGKRVLSSLGDSLICVGLAIRLFA